jgi:hypothetical protein
MIINEPMTTLTDYAIAVESGLFAILLICCRCKYHRFSRGLWAIAFGGTAIAAILGGTCHGFVTYLGSTTSLVLWRGMIHSLSLASAFMVWGTINTSVYYGLQPWLFTAIGLKSALCGYWAISHQDEFFYSAVDYLSAMFIVLILQVPTWRYQWLGAAYTTSGVALSGIAAALLWNRWSLVATLDPNVTYHLIQMAALFLLYQGVRSQSRPCP